MNVLPVYLCKKEPGNLCMDKWMCVSVYVHVILG